MRIGITGYATAGKDVVADVLTEQFDFVKINMSDALDEYLQVLNPWVGIDNATARQIGWPLSPNFYKYEYICERLDYVARKQIPEVRELLQRLGTDVGRAIDPWIWVKELEKEANKYPFVVTTGIRFIEEAIGLDWLIRVDRPGVGPINDHPSENLDAIFAIANITIHNDGSLGQLRATVFDVAKEIGLVSP